MTVFINVALPLVIKLFLRIVFPNNVFPMLIVSVAPPILIVFTLLLNTFIVELFETNSPLSLIFKSPETFTVPEISSTMLFDRFMKFGTKTLYMLLSPGCVIGSICGVIIFVMMSVLTSGIITLFKLFLAEVMIDAFPDGFNRLFCM